MTGCHDRGSHNQESAQAIPICKSCTLSGEGIKDLMLTHEMPNHRRTGNNLEHKPWINQHEFAMLHHSRANVKDCCSSFRTDWD